MGTGKAEANAVANIFREILSQETVDDGLVFDAKGLHAISIRDAACYGGVRVETEAMLERARVPVRIDIGYCDAVSPAPTEIDYPTLLKNHRYVQAAVVVLQFGHSPVGLPNFARKCSMLDDLHIQQLMES